MLSGSWNLAIQSESWSRCATSSTKCLKFRMYLYMPSLRGRLTDTKIQDDIPTVAWPTIVDKLSTLRKSHPPHPSNNINGDNQTALPQQISGLDAHDVANRIMRKENYLIALFNKSVLNLAVPVPKALLRSRIFAFIVEKSGLDVTTLDEAAEPCRSQLTTLSVTLEWNLSFCLMAFLFSPDGQVRRAFVQETSKADLIFASVGLRLDSFTRVADMQLRQLATTLRPHGVPERHVCSFHRTVSRILFLLSIFRGASRFH